MPYLLNSIITKINNQSKEEVHCWGMKLHRKSSTVRKHLKSMISFRNLNTKLIAKKSRRPQRPGISRHKQTFIKKNLLSVISKRILRCMLVKMKWVYTQMKMTANQLYFPNVKAVVVAMEMIQKSLHLLFFGRLW